MPLDNSPKPDADSQHRIRPALFGLAAILVGLALAALVFLQSHSTPTRVEPSTSSKSAVTSVISRSASAVVAGSHQSHPVPQIETEPETARLVSLLWDTSLTQQQRRQAARSLGKIGTDEAMAALKKGLAGDLPPYVKAAIAEGLGESPNPESTDLLHTLINDKDQTLARAAARGLALRGNEDAVDTLGVTLYNAQTPLSVRTEAALALGDVDLSSAQTLLTQAATQIHDEDVLESVLDGLARRPFSQTEEFFRNYLNSPEVSPSLKVQAIQSITDADGDVAPFLANYLNDPNPDVRAAAKEALDFLNPSGPVPIAK